MAGAGTVLGIGSLIAGGIGTGLKFFSAQHQAAATEAAARLNAEILRTNADLQYKYSALSASLQQKALEREATIARQNAAALFETAEIEEARGVEEIKRRRREFARFHATQRARIAKSGVVAAGSPVAVLAESAGIAQLQLNDIFIQSQNRATAFRNQGRGMLAQASAQAFAAKSAGATGALAAGFARDNAYTRANLGTVAAQNAARGIRRRGLTNLFTGTAQGIAGANSLGLI